MNEVQSGGISKWWSIMFYIAAVFNILAAVWSLLTPENTALLMYGSKTALDNPAASINSTAFLVFVIIFGIGYAMVAKDTSKNRGIVWLGIIGKLYVFSAWGFYCKAGLVTPTAFIGTSGDLIFSILFIIFLYKTREQA
jgi:hypothetical protein